MARILVVDDSPDVRLALDMILEDDGHDVVEAEDGDQVFDLAVAESPSLVLLDVMMPHVNGFDALAALKADTRTSPIPVIMGTATGGPEDMTMARSLGGVVAKSFIREASNFSVLLLSSACHFFLVVS